MFKKRTLDNGITVLTEKIPFFSSSVTGFWVNSGSRFEIPINTGYSHFIEHMLFKGTRTKSAVDIAQAVDKIGASINASTNKEFTIYYVHAMDEHLRFSVKMLMDMLQNSVFNPWELEKEKKVIMEEIKMYEDTPSEYVGDLFMESFMPDHPLGRPVIGPSENIANANRAKLLYYFKTHYTNERLMVAVAGRIGSDIFLKDIERMKLNPFSGLAALEYPEVKYRYGMDFRDREISQVHFIIGFNGIDSAHDLRYAMYLFNTILGGGMSSRLFQKIREKQGLCYSVFSYYVSYTDCGTFNIYCSTDAKNFRKTIHSILRECRKVYKELFTPRELREAKTQLKGQMALASENIEFIMNKMAMQERTFGKYVSLEEMFDHIDKVSMADIKKLAEHIFGGKFRYHLVSVGPKGHSKVG
jgi:predicted Zn-dependent peptidase